MALAIGDAAPPFELTNAHPSMGGPAMTFDDASGALGTVVVFECNYVFKLLSSECLNICRVSLLFSLVHDEI